MLHRVNRIGIHRVYIYMYIAARKLFYRAQSAFMCVSVWGAFSAIIFFPLSGMFVSAERKKVCYLSTYRCRSK